mmetsp:Transcript_29794/g.53040  ORF Transcript_29794/g.53040 Transcript_29794/m.53040 type:complete len:118 (+) Transcript_29794:701-1054(+)|eukprot:CAMPEP_0204908896 /NCGR_PEP_ID=MMETSP1397-20131031/7757_1 /ASSEMBLY_ACC=CAM_ASM_000891 /TAXON_ID=49980 /ORGANISM="Climacostomum Climacostomum virens, Strain Stock W-24" /LENGTH=117 /DNA_ID=CAMNT_0052078583 /DNA_START=695 /DNA_END=1048 /DNA_ORIENTATION=+
MCEHSVFIEEDIQKIYVMGETYGASMLMIQEYDVERRHWRELPLQLPSDMYYIANFKAGSKRYFNQEWDLYTIDVREMKSQEYWTQEVPFRASTAQVTTAETQSSCHALVAEFNSMS